MALHPIPRAFVYFLYLYENPQGLNVVHIKKKYWNFLRYDFLPYSPRSGSFGSFCRHVIKTPPRKCPNSLFQRIYSNEHRCVGDFVADIIT